MREVLARLYEILGLGRATVVKDEGGVQKIQVTDRRRGADGKALVTDDVQRLVDFGFTSNPPLESDVLVVRFGGDRSRPVAIATSHPESRLKNLGPGDTAIYDQRGSYIWLTPDNITIDANGQDVVIQNVGKVKIFGDLEVTGEVTAKSEDAAVSLSTHRHVLMGPSAPETGAPVASEGS